MDPNLSTTTSETAITLKVVPEQSEDPDHRRTTPWTLGRFTPLDARFPSVTGRAKRLWRFIVGPAPPPPLPGMFFAKLVALVLSNRMTYLL